MGKEKAAVILSRESGVRVDAISKDVAFVLGMYIHHCNAVQKQTAAKAGITTFKKCWPLAWNRLEFGSTERLLIVGAWTDWLPARSADVNAAVLFALFLLAENGPVALVFPQHIDEIDSAIVRCSHEDLMEPVRLFANLVLRKSIVVVAADARPYPTRFQTDKLRGVFSTLGSDSAFPRNLAVERNSLDAYLSAFSQSGLGFSSVNNSDALDDAGKQYLAVRGGLSDASVEEQDALALESELAQYYQIRLAHPEEDGQLA
ncbi:hypothetical protein HDU82_005586 [Entophlyctis luteolus]|nr:hypothetical protein HDU82_005586 [Entophlyctis luteolus]